MDSSNAGSPAKQGRQVRLREVVRASGEGRLLKQIDVDVYRFWASAG